MNNVDSKKRTTQKIFGTVINEDDASHLVGGIVEKGFSEQPLKPPTTWSSAPRPTVLPFPVARHRAHGPHWTPKVGIVRGYNNHDKEEDFTGMDQIGVFAKPMERKENKGLDFSRWREIVASDNSSVPSKREESARKLMSTSKERKDVAEISRNKSNLDERTPDKYGKGAVLSVEDVAKSQDISMEDEYMVQEQEEDMSMNIEKGGMEQSAYHSVLQEQRCGNGITEQEEEIIEDMHPTLQVKSQKHNIYANKTDATFDSQEVERRQNASSLESQIDAENKAQLARMSAEEIAEAQSELMAKFSPAMLAALKRKGQEKLKRGKSSKSGSHHSGEKGNLLDQMNNATSQGTLKNVKVDTPNLSASTSVWDDWSKRVESVRELRFSLDGNIVKSEFDVSKSGNTSSYAEQNLSERDYLRTEGDPGAAGYTIKEAVALARSLVPGQRTFAFHLIASVLDRAMHNIQQNQLGCLLRSEDRDGLTDWEAIWAFTLGPEPELALLLRMYLDDNHSSVVLACARAIQCALTFEINEEFFEIVERIPTLQREAPTAPVFRSRPEIEDGFLHGCFWKYNAKPSNILPFARDYLDNDENEHTIQDDVVVAGQDIVAGLIRMGILQRIQYLLETEPSTALEECLISILIAIARHSPTCAAAIMNCQQLVETIINRFTSKEQMEISTSKIKSVTLLKLLARFDKKNCLEFVKTGIVQKMTWHLYRYTSFVHWVKSGKEARMFSSALLVEQLRLWKVCVQHGYCVSFFDDLFPALCIWLNVPAFRKLIENSVLSEYTAIAKEAYLVLGALTRRLPTFYSHMQHLDRGTTKEAESWCWAQVGPMIDSALESIRIKEIPLLSHLFEGENFFLFLHQMGKKITTLRDLIGAIKDKASQSKAAFISKPSSFSLHLAVLRATTHAPSSPPDDHHISSLLTLGDSSRATASSLIVIIMDRLHRTGDSTVALKCLLIIHQIIKRGPFILLDQLSVFPSTGGRNYLKLSAFRDGATASRFTISAWIRFYSRYIESLLYTSRILGYFLSSSSTYNTDEKISTFLNSDLIRDVDSLVQLIEETVKLPDSLLLDGNKLLYEVIGLLNSDYLSTVNELLIRLSEFNERLSCLSFGDSVELSFILKRLEECKERLSILFSIKKPSTELLWCSVSELSLKINDLKVDFSKRKLITFEKSSESARFNNRVMKFGDTVQFSSGRYEMNSLPLMIVKGRN